MIRVSRTLPIDRQFARAAGLGMRMRVKFEDYENWATRNFENEFDSRAFRYQRAEKSGKESGGPMSLS